MAHSDFRTPRLYVATPLDGAPVAIWMERTLKSVAGCWTAARP